MASGSSHLSLDHFLCSICLDVFTDPVTTPCGHNFCNSCITQYWDSVEACRCPYCNESFSTRPKPRVNTFIREMTRESMRANVGRRHDKQRAKPGEVPCDVCTGTKFRALKSCLMCLASYCETHLEPHQKVAGLKRHQLIDPVRNLEDRVCRKHQQPLALFCQTEQVCVCQFCTESDHKWHPVVPLKEACEGRKSQLGKKEAEVQQMIQRRQLKIQEMKRSVKISEEEADREIAHSVQVFTALMSAMERCPAELIDTIQEKQKRAEEQAEGFIEELEEENRELKKWSTELQQLSHTKDDLQLLQSFSSLNTPPHTKDWTEVSVRRPSYMGTVRTAMERPGRTFIEEMKKLHEAELKSVQQYEVDVTLDPDTAHPYLILSEDGKQVCIGDTENKLPDNPGRFSRRADVLAKESFTSGRFYFEVVVKEKTGWVLGVARESVNRKREFCLSPENGLWTICLIKQNVYKALAIPAVVLSLRQKLQKVGVFVDYEEGLVSFYDVHAGDQIYSFTGCTFTKRLYPFFSLRAYEGGKNSAPLIISPVNRV